MAMKNIILTCVNIILAIATILLGLIKRKDHKILFFIFLGSLVAMIILQGILNMLGKQETGRKLDEIAKKVNGIDCFIRGNDEYAKEIEKYKNAYESQKIELERCLILFMY